MNGCTFCIDSSQRMTGCWLTFITGSCLQPVAVSHSHMIDFTMLFTIFWQNAHWVSWIRIYDHVIYLMTIIKPVVKLSLITWQFNLQLQQLTTNIVN